MGTSSQVAEPPDERCRPIGVNIRTGIVSATTLAVVAGAGVGVGVALAGSDGTGPTPPPGGSGDLVLANADLTVATDCDALLDSYVDRGLARVGPYGWDFGGIRMFGSAADSATGAEMSAGSPTTSAQSSVKTSRSTSNESGTNVQELGVDESDVVKVAGSLLLRLQDGTLRAYDVSGDEPTEVSSTPIPDAQGWPGSPGGELLFVDGRAVVFGMARDGASSTITTVDLADPTSPSIVDTVTVEGQLSAARLHGDVVRAVVTTGLPELDFRHPTGALGEIGSRLRNRALVRDTTLADWLPTVDGEPIVDCADVAVPTDEELELGSTTLVAFDPADPDARATNAVATTSPTSYFSTDRFYLAGAAASPMMWDCFDCADVADVGHHADLRVRARRPGRDVRRLR